MATTTIPTEGPAPGPDAGTDPGARPVDHQAPRRRRRIIEVLGRYWATTLLVAVVLGTSLATGALWTDVSEGGPLRDSVAYGLPALQDGRWWTFLTGMFIAPHPVLYLPILALLVLVASFYERRVGHVQTLVVAVGGQAVAGLGTALFLWPFDTSGWTWARLLGTEVDVGISAGGMALVGALSAVLQPVWCNRVRIGFGGYLVAMVLGSGLLWDVEHLVGFLLGVVAGPFLAGRLPQRPRLRFNRRTQRTAVALVIALGAVSSLVESVYPGNGGPFHTAGEPLHDPGTTLALALNALFLLVLADSLRRGRRVAWALTTLLLAVSFVGLLVGTDPSAERTADLVLAGAQLLLLLTSARAFTARPPRTSFRNAGRRLLVVVGVLAVYTAVGFVVLRDDFAPSPSPADVVTELLGRLVFTASGNIEPITTAANLFVTSIGAVWLTTIVVTAVGLLYVSRRPTPPPEADERLRELLAQHRSSNIQWMLTWPGTAVWLSDDRRTAIGYQVVGSVALCLADPVGPPEDRAGALGDFDRFCFDRGWIPCLFAAGQASADLAPALGWTSVQVAEDSVLALRDLEFKGKAFQDVRTAINKAAKEEVTVEVTRWADAPPVVRDQLRAISEGWVGDKALPEMGFTLGTLREADDPQVRLHLAVRPDRTIEGFTSWLPVGEDGRTVGWTLDLMRRRDAGFRPVMELLIGTSALRFKEEGYEHLSLSAAPLAKAADARTSGGEQQVLQKLLDFLAHALEPYYGFQSLFAFKQKFKPQHHPMYLVYPDSTTLAEIGIAVARAYMPTAGLRDWVRTAWELLSPAQPTT